ncbi:MAG: DUF1446 domain-containing protein [Oscillospiraceae bacterium]|nr:DUF1446 domain-containing protein [Oscillospiraceae bacterium]
MKKVAIGGGQGFWGDSPDAAVHMINTADIQYMACDYLAELTLSIMAKQQLKDPKKGYAPDFVTRILKEAGRTAKRRNIRLITNAGGMNIQGCVDTIRGWAQGEGLKGYKIGYVTGDDIKDQIPQLLRDGWTFPNLDGEGDFTEIVEKIYNCNAYIGHEGIEACIDQGADTVITGRAADSALFLAPLKHELGWAADDWDSLARGIMAGHLLECGGQGAGGNYMYDWHHVPRMDELGFPIAELTAGTLELTKAPDCGGVICEQSTKEQFLYEVLDPANYITPDVVVDVSGAAIRQQGENRVRVEGIRGRRRPDTLKLCVGYHKGWKTVSMLSFAWPDAYEKARYCAEVIMKKMARIGMRADDVHISYIGLNSLHLNVADTSERAVKDLNECVLRIAVFSRDKAECAKIIPEISPLQLNGPPGASFFGGRARVQEVMALWPTTVPRDAVKAAGRVIEA